MTGHATAVALDLEFKLRVQYELVFSNYQCLIEGSGTSSLDKNMRFSLYLQMKS